MAELNFDARQVPPAGTYEVLPEGRYTAEIVASGVAATKRGDGEYLSLRWRITGGDYDGRTIVQNLNLKNPNAQAVEIAKRELSAICHAVGVLRPNFSEDLHNIPAVITVGHKRREDTGELTNVIKKVASYAAAMNPAASIPPDSKTDAKPPPPAEPVDDSRPPWE